MIIFTGVATALMTPFTPDASEIDYEAFAKAIDWQIAQGVNALVVAGTTGEAAALTEEEHKALITFAVAYTRKRVPVIAGTGSNNTAHAIHMTQFASSVGADAALIVNPYYNKTTQAGLIAHYTAIHQATDIPIILYNVPSRTGMNISPNTVAQLAEMPRIVALKEASNQFSQITELARLLPESFSLYSGNDDTVLPFLSLGGRGVISVASNLIPNQLCELVTAYQKGQAARSRDLQLMIKPFIDALFLETSPAPAKFAAAYLEREQGPLRLPMIAVETATQQAIIQTLTALNLDKGWTLPDSLRKPMLSII